MNLISKPSQATINKTPALGLAIRLKGVRRPDNSLHSMRVQHWKAKSGFRNKSKGVNSQK